MIEQGSQVSIEYTLKNDDGEVVDTNVGGDALTYTQGGEQILPALEEALAGKAVGDTEQVSLTPEQGYGEVNDSLFETVPATSVPEGARTVGTQLVAQSPDGQSIPIRVHEVRDEEIVIDLNHPLAGEPLHFEVKVLAVE